MARSALLVISIAMVALTSGCTHVNAWQRGKLAHPTMTNMGEPSPALEHVYSVQEGAVGGNAEAGGGCGCN